jgi:hypothetical protein
MQAGPAAPFAVGEKGAAKDEKVAVQDAQDAIKGSGTARMAAPFVVSLNVS